MTEANDIQILWNWDFTKKFVGPVIFGADAESIIQEYKLVRTPEYEAQDQELYEFPDGSSISVESGVVSGVDCKSNFFYQGINLIGLSIETLRSFLGAEDFLEKFETLISLDYDKYNLVVWIEKNTNKVKNIFAYSDE